MSKKTGNVVIAGDKVFAGIDESDRSTCRHAMVIEFKTPEDLAKALREGVASFTVFEDEQS